jgi:hypothetical protein
MYWEKISDKRKIHTIERLIETVSFKKTAKVPTAPETSRLIEQDEKCPIC